MSYGGPGRYRHYKGGEYEVLGVGLEEATHRYVVIYQPVAGWPTDLPTAEFWTRPFDDFNALVDVRLSGGRPVHRVPRFEKIETVRVV